MGSGFNFWPQTSIFGLRMIRSRPFNFENVIIRTALDLILTRHESATNILTQTKMEPRFLRKITERNVSAWHSGPFLQHVSSPAQPSWEYWLGRIALEHPLHPTGRSTAQWSHTFLPETLLLVMEIGHHPEESKRQLSFTASTEMVVFTGLTTKP